MNKKMIYALLLIGLFAVVLVLTKGSTRIHLIFDVVSCSTSFALLGAAALGVIVGQLLK